MRRRRASDLRSLLLRGHGAVVEEADEFGEVDEECARVNAGSGSHNLDAPYLARQRCRGETVLLEHLWGRSPFSVRRGAEVAQRADRGDTHTQTRKDFTQLRAARMRNTLLLLVWIDSSSCSGAQEATVSLEFGRG